MLECLTLSVVAALDLSDMLGEWEELADVHVDEDDMGEDGVAEIEACSEDKHEPYAYLMGTALSRLCYQSLLMLVSNMKLNYF